MTIIDDDKIKYYLIALDHENSDLNWDDFDNEKEAREALESEEDDYKKILIHGQLIGFNC